MKKLCSVVLAMCMVAALLVAGTAPASATTAEPTWQSWQMDCGFCIGCRVVWRVQRWWCGLIRSGFRWHSCGYCDTWAGGGNWNGGRPTRCWFPKPIGLSEPGDITHPYVGNMAAIAGRWPNLPVDGTMQTSVRDGRFILFIHQIFPNTAQYSLELIAVEDCGDEFNIRLRVDQISGGLTVITHGVIIIELDEALLDQDFSVVIT